MHNNARLTINGKESDLPKDLNSITLVRRFFSFDKIYERSGDFSYELVLPLSERNRVLFRNAENLSVEYNEPETYDCVLYHNDVSIFIGKLKVNRITDNGYHCNIFSSIATLKSIIGDLTLRDIRSFIDIEFLGTETILNSVDLLNTSYIAGETLRDRFPHDVIYPLLAYGKFFIPNEWSSPNHSRFLPTQEYVPLSTQSNTDIALPDNKHILNNDTWYLDFTSQPVATYAEFPPAVFVLSILENILKDAGYSLNGRWVNNPKSQYLFVPYTADRFYIYNWQTIGRLEASTFPMLPFVEVNQSVYYSISATTTFGVMTIARLSPISWDKFNPLSDTFDTGYRNTSNGIDETFTHPTVLYNILSFINNINDISLTLYTSPSSLLGVPAYSIFTAPCDAEYEFNYNFIIENNYPYNFEFDYINKRNLTPRAFGVTKFTDSIPSDICFGYTYDNSVTNKDLLHSINLNTAEPNDIITGTFRAVLNRGDRVIFWIGIVSLYNGVNDISTNHTNGVSDYVRYIDPLKPFVVSPDGLRVDNFFIECGIEIKNMNIGITPYPKEGTPENEQFGELLRIAPNLPNEKQIDFIKSLCLIFNLYLYIDENSKTVYIDSLDDVIYSSSNPIDMNKSINLSDGTIEIIKQPKYRRFVWNADDKDAVRLWYDDNYSYELSNENGSGTETIDSGIFSPTYVNDFYTVYTNNINDFVNPNYQRLNKVIIPHMSNQDDIDTALNEIKSSGFDFKTRILSLAGIQQIPADPNYGRPINMLYFNDNVGGGTSRGRVDVDYLDKFIISSFTDDLYGHVYNLSFSGNSGLVSTFYSRTLTSLSARRRWSGKAYITATEFANFSIYSKVSINGNTYIVESLENFSPFSVSLTEINLLTINT